jgi:hypothetical protein
MLTARSQLLTRHVELYDSLVSQLHSLGTKALAPCAVPLDAAERATAQELDEGKADEKAAKRVSFADEKGGHLERGPEEAKAEAARNKGALKKEESKEDAAAGSGTAEDGEAQEAPAEPAVEPIHLAPDFPSSLTRLAAALRSSASSSAPKASPRVASVTAVADDSSDDWESSEMSDGLEFDPFAPPRPSALRRRRAKHGGTTSASVPDLSKSIGSFNAFLHAQTLAAATPLTPRYGFTQTATSAKGSGESGSEREGRLDVGVLKAEIRSLKGLLLSR